MFRSTHEHYSVGRLRTLWFVGGLCASTTMVVLWWTLIAVPMREHFNTLRAEMSEAYELVKNQATIELNLLACREQASRWRAEEAEGLLRSSAEQDLADFLQWTDRQARECGLAVRDFRPGNRESISLYTVQSITLSTQGDYSAVCGFLDRLRNCPRMNRLTNVEIAPRDPARATYELTLQIALLSQPAPPPATTLVM